MRPHREVVRSQSALARDGEQVSCPRRALLDSHRLASVANVTDDHLHHLPWLLKLPRSHCERAVLAGGDAVRNLDLREVTAQQRRELFAPVMPNVISTLGFLDVVTVRGRQVRPAARLHDACEL